MMICLNKPCFLYKGGLYLHSSRKLSFSNSLKNTFFFRILMCIIKNVIKQSKKNLLYIFNYRTVVITQIIATSLRRKLVKKKKKKSSVYRNHGFMHSNLIIILRKYNNISQRRSTFYIFNVITHCKGLLLLTIATGNFSNVKCTKKYRKYEFKPF